MQKLFIGLEGDGGVRLLAERRFGEDLALTRWVKLHEGLFDDAPPKKRGRRAAEAPGDDESTTVDATNEPEGER